MKEKTKIAVVFGGSCSEHEVSCLSAASILRNLDKDKYEIYKLGITKDGQWFYTDASVDVIEKDEWQNDKSNRRAIISPDCSMQGIVFIDGTTEVLPVDCVFSALHGNNCEDGVMQGLMELSGIPYTGSGVAASACGMDKAITKVVVNTTDVKQADYYIVNKAAVEADKKSVIDGIESHFGEYPLFVKPASEGSSVGISKAHDREELVEAVDLALKYDKKVLVEETIVGREIEVAVLGNEDPKATAPGEILACNEFYDYNAKYVDNKSITKIVDDFDEELLARFKEDAVTVYRALGCSGLARVDFFLKENGEIVFNEINTLPGFTKISMYPQLWAAEGIAYSELLDKLIDLAIKKRNS